MQAKDPELAGKPQRGTKYYKHTTCRNAKNVFFFSGGGTWRAWGASLPLLQVGANFENSSHFLCPKNILPGLFGAISEITG